MQTSVESCDVSAQDNMRRTALHWAAVLGYAEIANLLLQRGISFAASDENGATALHYAVRNLSASFHTVFCHNSIR